MENKLILDRAIHSARVLILNVISGVALCLFAQKFLGGFHLVILTGLAIPFLLSGVKMQPVDSQGWTSLLFDSIIYMVPFAIGQSILIQKKATSATLAGRGRSLHKRFLFLNLKTFAVVFVLQAVIVAGLLVSGLAQMIQERYIYWITWVIAPADYRDVGQARFIVPALLLNTLMFMVPLIPIYSLICFPKEVK